MNRTIARTLSFLGLAIAVFVVGMAGSATAAKLITGKDIKNNSVASADIKNSTVKAKDVKDGALTGKDVKAATIDETRLAADVRTKLNAAALHGYEVVSDSTTVSAGTFDTVYAHCPEGKVAVGGSAEFATPATNLVVTGSGPREYLEPSALYAPATVDHADAWAATVDNPTINLENVTVAVLCADPS